MVAAGVAGFSTGAARPFAALDTLPGRGSSARTPAHATSQKDEEDRNQMARSRLGWYELHVNPLPEGDALDLSRFPGTVKHPLRTLFYTSSREHGEIPLLAPLFLE